MQYSMFKPCVVEYILVYTIVYSTAVSKSILAVCILVWVLEEEIEYWR